MCQNGSLSSIEQRQSFRFSPFHRLSLLPPIGNTPFLIKQISDPSFSPPVRVMKGAGKPPANEVPTFTVFLYLYFHIFSMSSMLSEINRVIPVFVHHNSCILGATLPLSLPSLFPVQSRDQMTPLKRWWPGSVRALAIYLTGPTDLIHECNQVSDRRIISVTSHEVQGFSRASDIP